MPPTKRKSAPGLEIQLADPKPFITPGDTIVGKVILSSASDQSIGTVSIRFFGRIKTYFVQHHGQGESHWKGRAPIHEENSVLYEGKHTHQPGSFSWPFKFSVPTHPDEALVRSFKNQWKAKAPFLSTYDDIFSHPLPPTFKFSKHGFGYRYQSFVEWVLEVTMKEPEESHVLKYTRTKKTTLPLTLMNPPQDDPITRPLPGIEFSLPAGMPEKSNAEQVKQRSASRMVSQTSSHTVKSLKLLPHNRDADLSLRQRASSLFKSSDLPRFTFNVTVSRPDTVQVLAGEGIPIKMSLSPVADPSQNTLTPESYPTVRVDTISLVARAKTHIRWKSLMRDRDLTTSYDIDLLEKQPVGYEFVLGSNGEEVLAGRKEFSAIIPDSNSDMVDLCAVARLSPRLTAAKLGRQTENPVVPTFKSYIISRDYELKWKIELDVTGSKVKVESDGDQNLVVLAPVEESARHHFEEVNGQPGLPPYIEEEEDEDDDSGSEGGGSVNKGLTSKMSKLLPPKKKSKAQEAAEDRADTLIAGDEDIAALPAYEDVTAAGTTSGRSGPVQPDSLPQYEARG